jgi:hypothetical protein
MSRQHFDEQSTRKYTLTIFLSFAAVFCFVMLMMLWRGDYKPGEASEVKVIEPPSNGHALETNKEPSVSDSVHSR